jgi:hypothetical protein
MTATIHAELDRKHLLPTEHIVDTGYVDAKLLVESQRDYQIDLVGPTRKNYRWQASQHTGFDAEHFLIDWQQQQATCPQGQTSISWTPAIDNRKNEGDLDQVLDQGLSGLSISIALYPIQSPHAPYRDHSTASAVSGPHAQARTGTDEGIYPDLCQASGH